jgi:hypothetical protein
MSYRNKTYVIFDGDNDRWAYAGFPTLSRFSKGGKQLAQTPRFLVADLQPQDSQGLHRG